MKLNRKLLIVCGAVVAVAAGGIGIAQAVGGDSEESVTGPSADKAKAAALDRVGGGTVLEIERQDGDGSGAYEVEVRRDDGSTVEVTVSGNYEPVSTGSDDDSGSSENEGNDSSDDGGSDEGEGSGE